MGKNYILYFKLKQTQKTSLSNAEEEDDDYSDDCNDGYSEYYDQDYSDRNSYSGNERKMKLVVQNHVRTAVSNPGKAAFYYC